MLENLAVFLISLPPSTERRRVMEERLASIAPSYAARIGQLLRNLVHLAPTGVLWPKSAKL
jgi:hypothetical protein